MNSVTAYLLRVISASIICAIVMQVLKNNSGSSKIIKCACGVFLSVTLLSPLMSWNMRNVTDYFDGIKFESDQIVTNAVSEAEESKCRIIIERTEAYITDEAKRLDLVLDVEVSLGKEYPYVPESVKIYGEASPYQKQMIILYIENKLGILRENVQWI